MSALALLTLMSSIQITGTSSSPELKSSLPCKGPGLGQKPADELHFLAEKCLHPWQSQDLHEGRS